ncbi:hypothetical protein TNCT_101461 [Trichonephila clavata]|uniref:Uncharacterized protein n=1 Tax=Trichonephila clavata TaxID=2740835 RepID=A0A8X6H657_TRICU|nr:hypothetical protein TNCT_101461 [Trichonephila clavata]
MHALRSKHDSSTRSWRWVGENFFRDAQYSPGCGRIQYRTLETPSLRTNVRGTVHSRSIDTVLAAGWLNVPSAKAQHLLVVEGFRSEFWSDRPSVLMHMELSTRNPFVRSCGKLTKSSCRHGMTFTRLWTESEEF